MVESVSDKPLSSSTVQAISVSLFVSLEAFSDANTAMCEYLWVTFQSILPKCKTNNTTTQTLTDCFELIYLTLQIHCARKFFSVIGREFFLKNLLWAYPKATKLLNKLLLQTNVTIDFSFLDNCVSISVVRFACMRESDSSMIGYLSVVKHSLCGGFPQKENVLTFWLFSYN